MSDLICKWCNSNNVSCLHHEHGAITVEISNKYDPSSHPEPVTFCYDCGRITPPGENHYKPKKTDAGERQ